MNRNIKLFALPLLLCGALVAQSAKDAEGFVKEGVAFAKSNGKDAFLKEVNTGRFSIAVKKTLYISVYGMDGTVLGHGAKASKVGSNEMGAKDSNGKAHVKARIDLASAQGSGWVDYTEVNPTTGAVEPKTSFVEKVGDMVISCGTYKR